MHLPTGNRLSTALPLATALVPLWQPTEKALFFFTNGRPVYMRPLQWETLAGPSLQGSSDPQHSAAVL